MPLSLNLLLYNSNRVCKGPASYRRDISTFIGIVCAFISITYNNHCLLGNSPRLINLFCKAKDYCALPEHFVDSTVELILDL